MRLIFSAFGGLILFVALCWGAFHGYRSWQQRHLVRRAAAFLSGGDLKAANLSARRAFQLNENNAEAARLIADIAERAGDPSVEEWRRTILRLQPNSVSDALALVRCALRLNDLVTAERTLAGVNEEGKGTAAYHAACGRLAEIKKDVVGAEAHWQKAIELAPRDASYQFQLALVRLGTNDQAKRDGARATLESLRSDPAQRAAATRSLIIANVALHEDAHRARDLAQELQGYSDATFSDRLLYLEILRQLHDASFDDSIQKVEGVARTSPADASALISWMNANSLALRAEQFVQTLPEDVADKWPVPPGRADTFAQLQDWPALERFAGAGTWGSYDFLRRAYLVRALRAQDKTIAAEREWSAARKEASAQPRLLLLLTRTIASWNWQTEVIDLLWTLTRFPEARTEALQNLYQSYGAHEDTAGLYRALLQLLSNSPEDRTMQNNFAQVSLLLNADPERAAKLAADLHAEEPGQAAYASTYAFALYKKGTPQRAVTVMESLGADQLRDPSIAAYYGIFLAAAGQKEKAREYLEIGSNAKLLPEEKALLARAKAVAQ